MYEFNINNMIDLWSKASLVFIKFRQKCFNYQISARLFYIKLPKVNNLANIFTKECPTVDTCVTIQNLFSKLVKFR